MIIGIPSEIKAGEKRVAMSPANVQSLTDKSVKVLIQADAGSAAGYPDAEYTRLEQQLQQIAQRYLPVQILFCKFRALAQTMKTVTVICASYAAGRLVIGMMDPLASPQAAQAVARDRCHSHCPGTGAAHQSRPEYGCTFIHGHIGRLQSRA